MKDYNFPLLIAEGDPDDVMLLRKALTDAGTINPVHVVGDGKEAIDYLAGEGKFSDRDQYPMPKVLVTEINMRKCSGLELLKWMHDHEFHAVPSLVLTHSNQPQNIEEAFRWGAHGYFVKP